MAKEKTKEPLAKARRQNKSATERRLDDFELRCLRLRFLITASVVHYKDMWSALYQGPFQDYLSLVDKQFEALCEDGSQEHFRISGSDRIPAGAVSENPIPRKRSKLELQLLKEFHGEKSRVLADFERVFGQKDEKERRRQDSQQSPFIHDSHTDAPDFLNLDGSDDRVRELRERVRNWLNTWHLGENWCAETLINVMARQKEILERAHLRSIPQPYTDHWEIAWAKRFYTFIDDVQKRLAECGMKDVIFAPSLVQAWKLEWMESAIESFRTFLTTMPPLGYPRWLPDFESDKEYLKVIEGAVKRELINSPLLSCAIGNDWEKLVKRLMPKAKDYSQELDSERKANKGIKREKAKPEEVKHIIWAVQYWVMRMRREEIASASTASEDAVRTGVKGVLRMIGLYSRGELDRRKRGGDIKKGRHIAEGSR